MKKTILILLLAIPLNGFSQLKIENGFGLTYSNDEDYYTNYMFFRMDKITALNQMRLVYSNWSLISDVNIYMHQTPNKITFTPTLIDFKLTLRYNYNKFNIEISHRCLHPIITKTIPLDFEIYGGYTFKLKLLYNIK